MFLYNYYFSLFFGKPASQDFMGGDHCQKFFIYLFYSHKNYNEGWWADYEGTAFVKMDDHSFPGSGIL